MKYLVLQNGIPILLCAAFIAVADLNENTQFFFQLACLSWLQRVLRRPKADDQPAVRASRVSLFFPEERITRVGEDHMLELPHQTD